MLPEARDGRIYLRRDLQMGGSLEIGLSLGSREPATGASRKRTFLACASDAISRENEGLTVLQSIQSASGRSRSRNPSLPSAVSWTAAGWASIVNKSSTCSPTAAGVS